MSECGLEREAIQELLPGHFCIVRLGGEEEPTKEAEKEQPAVERKRGAWRVGAKWKERFRDSSIIDCVRTLNKIKTKFTVGFSNMEAMKDPEKKLVFVDSQ